MIDLVIIGGGAAGLACAITAARRGLRVTVLERMDRIGKKLLATGNGRCNLMNTADPRYPGGSNFASAVLERCGVDAQQAFWHSLGLQLREEDGGRVYPVSGQASSVLDALRLGLALHGVQVETGVYAETVEEIRGGFRVVCGDKTFKARNVMIAGGGKAQPKLGSDGSAMELLRKLGHNVRKCWPALTQIRTEEKAIAGLSGIRVRGDVSVLKQGKLLYCESGEILFADYGVSGVCVMQCARYAQAGTQLSMDFLPGMGFSDENEVIGEMRRRREEWRTLPMEQLLTGLCVPRLSSALCKAAGIKWKDRFVGYLNDREIASLANTMHSFVLDVTGVKGFEQAQVTAGGADTAEFDPVKMESRIVPGLYAAGEVLDVDGDCGGFNLMFAFACGIIAGNNMEGLHDHR